MHNLVRVLRDKPRGLLNIYCTAGYPSLHDLPVVIEALRAAGADMVEIGIPYSDPLADGPVIQQSNTRALANGISLRLIFEQLAGCAPDFPKILMGYYNPVLRFGMERFLDQCAATGVDGVILPDLPMDLWEERYRKAFDERGVSMIFLVTPQTSEARIRKMDALSTTFLYAVTQTGTTGKTGGVTDAGAYLARLAQMQLRHPVLAGFSISRPEDLQFVQSHVQGGIIGSAFIRHLGSATDVAAATQSFVEPFIRTTAI